MNDPLIPNEELAAIEFSISQLGTEVSNALTLFNGPHKDEAVAFVLECLRVDGEHVSNSPLTALQIVDSFREFARRRKLPWLSLRDHVESAIREAKP